MEMSKMAMEFLIGIVLIGISIIFGLTIGVQVQAYVTASSGNFTGLSLFVVQNVVTFFMLIILAFGAGFVYKAVKGSIN
jgi:hypothetical protein